MRRNSLNAACGLLAACVLVSAEPTNLADLRRAFEHPPDDARIMMRWWWFGPSVTKPELEREMRLMKEGGIGGFEVQAVYPLALDDEKAGIRNLQFLSDEFLDALRFTSFKAHELGLRMDLTLGSGWPYGGPHIPVSQSAGKLRWERVRIANGQRRIPIPSIAEGEQLLGAFAAPGEGDVRELAVIRDGAVWLPPGIEAPREVWFFIASRTGMMVKRASLGSEGFVLDHYDSSATKNHLQSVGDRLMKAFVDQRPHAIFCDSLEVFGSDWTADFLEEFRRRRGYDLKPHLPALVAGAGPKTSGIRHDWGKTLTELVEDHFLAPMAEWAKRNRTLFRIQGYGIPPATLSSYLHSDLPEGEGFQWKTLSSSRWASSASHLYDKPVTSSETWTWLHSPSFRATPLDVKAEADLHFLQGVNQLIGHGWPYTSEGVEYPGWRFYAAAVFDEKNPWWIVMPDVSAYLQRLSFLLRQGKPANDVAVYLPNSDAWSHFSPGRANMLEALRDRLGPDIVARIVEAGYNLDFFDDRTLRLDRYRMAILPGVETVPVKTFRKLEEFAKSGGILVATRRLPSNAPGFAASDAEHLEVRQISQRLFQGTSAPAHFVEDENRDLGGKLNVLLRPDVSFAPAAPAIGFIHRRTSFAEVYFVANTGNVPQHVNAAFRVDAAPAEMWDPSSGRSTPVAIATTDYGTSTVRLDLEPYASRVLVFSKSGVSRDASVTEAPLPPPVDISSGWKVKFGDSGSQTTMKNLKSWTEDEATRYYSGAATYEKNVIAPENLFGNGVRIKLDFGEGTPSPDAAPRSGMRAMFAPPIREAAVIYVNGRRAGSLWRPPYSLDITELLKRGENRIRVVVANLAVNYMAGHSQPNYRLLNLRYGARFEAQDMDKIEPVPAGLLGPVRIVAGRREP